MSSNNMYNILNVLKSLEPTTEQTVKAEAKRIYESVEAQGSITEGVGAVEARLRQQFAESDFSDTSKAIQKSGKSKASADAITASIGRKKLGQAEMTRRSVAGKKHAHEGVAEAGQNPHTSAIGKALYRDLSKEKKASPAQVEKNKARWAQRQADKEKGVAENAKPDYIDLDKDGNKKESMKKAAKDNVRVHKGTYGTEYDPSDEEKKDRPKREIKHGQKGRPRAEKPLDTKVAPRGDIFGRTTGDVPKGKKGTRVKGKDMVDEVNIDTLNQLASHPMAGPLAAAGGAAIGAAVGKGITKANDWYQKRKEKQALAQRTKQGMHENMNYKRHNFMLESFNFANMMKEADQTVQEMLEELQKDIGHYKMTGECSPKLDAFLRVHGHSKKQLADEAKTVPNYEVPAVQRKAAGEPPLSLSDVHTHDTHRSMHPGMTKLDAPKPAHHHIHDELDELAQLAGITDEGNAFTGKLANTAHGDSFDLDGKTYKDTSQLDEETCNECGMYESQCSCTEGNLFTKKLAQTPKGSEFELDGKQYKDTSNLDEASLKLEDIAKLAGIAVEGKDYGDASFNEAPTYDNTPDEQVQGEDVLLKGGDGEVAGAEKKMAKDGAARFSDNPLAMKESETKAADLMKEAATFDPIEAMGRKLMKQYESIKLQK